MSPTKSSTYRSPLTTVPAGVMVTLMVPVWPGLRTSGENDADGLTACCQKSPLAAVIAGSNAFAVADMLMLTVPAGAPAGYGPHSAGTASQAPEVTTPSGGV